MFSWFDIRAVEGKRKLVSSIYKTAKSTRVVQRVLLESYANLLSTILY